MATPSAPVISNAPLASPNTLEYWWYPPTSDGGAAIEDYQLVLNPGGLTCNVGGPGTYYKVTGLTNAQTYFTTIAASNANGLGATASFREFQPGSPPPVGVSTLSATAVFLFVIIIMLVHHVRLIDLHGYIYQLLNHQNL
jgi:hypothetical protein